MKMNFSEAMPRALEQDDTVGSQEKNVSPEQQEEYTSKIELNFFRHGDKEADKTKSDQEIRLNEAGRKQAFEKSVKLKNPKLAKALGGPRVRSQETAALVMEGQGEDIPGAEVRIDNLEEIAGAGLMNSPRVVEDERLDFQLDESTPSGAISLDNFKQGRYLKWLVEESDAVTKENGDLNANSSYSKSAAHIASIIKDYYNASGRWDQIIKAEKTRQLPKGYDKSLERFLGSHQGVTESFLAKVVEKTQGVAERDRLVEILGNKGFGFVEGFKIEILNQGNEDIKILVEYEKKNESGETAYEIKQEISKEILDEIIADAESVA